LIAATYDSEKVVVYSLINIIVVIAEYDFMTMEVAKNAWAMKRPGEREGIHNLAKVVK